MSGKGDGLDKAVAERCFGSLKRERTSKRYYRTRQAARDDILDSIEMFYNSWRKHSYLGYVRPNAYEKIAQVASCCVRFHLTTTDPPHWAQQSVGLTLSAVVSQRGLTTSLIATLRAMIRKGLFRQKNAEV